MCVRYRCVKISEFVANKHLGHMRRNVRKRTFELAPAKIQISLQIRQSDQYLHWIFFWVAYMDITSNGSINGNCLEWFATSLKWNKHFIYTKGFICK